MSKTKSQAKGESTANLDDNVLIKEWDTLIEQYSESHGGFIKHWKITEPETHYAYKVVLYFDGIPSGGYSFLISKHELMNTTFQALSVQLDLAYKTAVPAADNVSESTPNTISSWWNSEVNSTVPLTLETLKKGYMKAGLWTGTETVPYAYAYNYAKSNLKLDDIAPVFEPVESTSEVNSLAELYGLEKE